MQPSLRNLRTRLGKILNHPWAIAVGAVILATALGVIFRPGEPSSDSGTVKPSEKVIAQSGPVATSSPATPPAAIPAPPASSTPLETAPTSSGLPATPTPEPVTKPPAGPVSHREPDSKGPDANQEDAIIARNAEAFSPVSMSDFFSRWYDESTTDLQRDQLESDLIGKTIIWTGKITNIEPGRNRGIRVLASPPDGTYGNAFLDFDAKYRNDFLSIKTAQTIRFTGTIREFISSPFIEDCRLLDVSP
jgi:hypothetical protein